MKQKLREKNNKVKNFFIKLIKKVITFAVVCLVLVGAYKYLDNKQQQELTNFKEQVQQEAAEQKELTKAETKALIATLKSELINDISLQETGRPIKDGELFYVNDPQKSKVSQCQRVGGKRPIYCDSWGAMMFKITTVQHYSDKLRGTNLTEVEALTLALNETEAKKLATEIIFEEVGGVWNWSVTHDEKKYFDKQVNTIRNLQAKLTN